METSIFGFSLLYTTTTSSQLALNIILATWYSFYNFLQKLQPTLFQITFLKIEVLLHVTDIPTINYSAKYFLEQELSVVNCVNFLYLMSVILLLTIYLIAYQQLLDKGPWFC